MTEETGKDAASRIMDAFRRYRADPALFAERILRMQPTGQQRRFLDAVARPGAKVAVRSGHGVGKSTALAAAALWFLFTHGDALIPCTAPTAHQLEDVLWRELRRLAGRMDDWWRPQLAIAAGTVRLAGSAGMIAARTARPEKPDALQGFHARHILFLIDEAPGVPDAVFEVARGALSTPAARVAMTGNPTRLSGYFHAAFHSARDAWERLHFPCPESPLVASGYAGEIAREYGEDSDMYRVRVLGDFPKGGFNTIIPADLAEAAAERTHPRHMVDHAARVMGVDPALTGDRKAVVVRQGLSAWVSGVHRSPATTQEVGSWIAALIEKESPDGVFIDQTGNGAGVRDYLAGLGFGVVGVNFGGRPDDRARFVDKRSEMWWRVREWLERDDPSLSRDRDLKDDLTGPEYTLTFNGRIRLESKGDMRARGLASPDLGDALALTFAAPVRPKDIVTDRVRLAHMRNSMDTDDSYDPLGR